MSRTRMLSAIGLVGLSLLVMGCPKKKAPEAPPPPPTAGHRSAAGTRSRRHRAPVVDETPDPWDAEIEELNAMAARQGLLGDVYFDFDKFELRPDARERLAKNAEFMRQHPNFQFTVEGHCDERGTNEYNLTLGQSRSSGRRRRTSRVLGVGNAMRTISYGEERPVCTESRRVLLAAQSPGPLRRHRQVAGPLKVQPPSRRSPPARRWPCWPAPASAVRTSPPSRASSATSSGRCSRCSSRAPASRRSSSCRARSPARPQALIKSEADVQVALRDLSTQIDQLQANLEDTNFRLSQLSQQIAATNQELNSVRSLLGGSGLGAPSSSAAARRGPSATADPQALYQSAYNDYLRGNYDLAIRGFGEYLRPFPDTEQSDNAAYWIGECYFSQGRYRQAIGEFDKMLNRYPRSDKLASALLKKGYAYLELQPARAGRGAAAARPAPVPRHRRGEPGTPAPARGRG